METAGETGEEVSGQSPHVATIREYLAALEAGATADALARFFTPDAEQVELPNRLNLSGSRSDLATLKARADQGKKLLREQHYEIRSIVANGDAVAVEARWSAVLAVPVATLAESAVMKAHFAMFFVFEGGRIRSQRNYDCFEPW